MLEAGNFLFRKRMNEKTSEALFHKVVEIRAQVNSRFQNFSWETLEN